MRRAAVRGAVSKDGIFDSVCYQKKEPGVVLLSGYYRSRADAVPGGRMGDALSTWFEARSCDRTQSVNECGGHSTMAGLNIAKLCYETLLSYGAAARVASEGISSHRLWITLSRRISC